MTQSNTSDVQADEFEIGHASPERVRAANEVGAAIAHELNGPLTALLLYVGDLHQNGDRFPAADGDRQSLTQAVKMRFVKPSVFSFCCNESARLSKRRPIRQPPIPTPPTPSLSRHPRPTRTP